ncbi:MAG: LPP20 family lipoprotein [Deferribacterales bacterium]
MKRLLLFTLMLAVAAGCMTTKTAVKQDNAKAQQAKAAAAQAEMESDIQAGTPSLDFAKELEAKPQPKPEEKPKAVMPEKTQPSKLSSLKPQAKYPVREGGFPEWFYTPVYDGYVGAVGIAPKQKSFTAQKRVAKMQAQKNLAKQIEVLVKSEVNVESLGVDSATVQEYRLKVTSLTKEQVDQYLTGFKVQDEWIDEKSGDYYVWMVLQK